MVDGGDQAGVTVDDPDSNAWDKPRTKSGGLEGEKKQYAKFCDNFKNAGSNKAYVLAALQLHDLRWTEADVDRVIAAWQGASGHKDIDERIAALCDIAVARAVPGDKATYSGDRGPKWPQRGAKGKDADDTLRLKKFFKFWENMKVANQRFKEFAAAMVARDCGWSHEQVHALVNANRTEAQRAKFPLP